MSKSKHILIVDDEVEIRKIIQEILNDEGYSTSTASSAEEARIEANNKRPDLVFLDIWMPEEDGISLLRDWKSQSETEFPVIMISGHATIETAIQATKLGARDFIEKPVSIEKLLTSAEEVLSQDIVGEDVFSHLVQNIPTLSEEENKGVIAEYTEMTQLSFKQDVDIWHNKIRVDNPLMCDGDGPLHKLREWYNQFYVDRDQVRKKFKKLVEIEA